jgi:hypothetical protein
MRACDLHAAAHDLSGVATRTVRMKTLCPRLLRASDCHCRYDAAAPRPLQAATKPLHTPTWVANCSWQSALCSKKLVQLQRVSLCSSILLVCVRTRKGAVLCTLGRIDNRAPCHTVFTSIELHLDTTSHARVVHPSACRMVEQSAQDSIAGSLAPEASRQSAPRRTINLGSRRLSVNTTAYE